MCDSQFLKNIFMNSYFSQFLDLYTVEHFRINWQNILLNKMLHFVIDGHWEYYELITSQVTDIQRTLHVTSSH